MLLYAWIVWNLIGGVTAGFAVNKCVKRNKKEQFFMETCNDILEVLRSFPCSTPTLRTFMNQNLDDKTFYDCLNFLSTNYLIERSDANCKYYLVKKER